MFYVYQYTVQQSYSGTVNDLNRCAMDSLLPKLSQRLTTQVLYVFEVLSLFYTITSVIK